MVEAPEKIWAEDIGETWWFSTIKGLSTVPYTRSDIAERQIAELRMENDRLKRGLMGAAMFAKPAALSGSGAGEWRLVPVDPDDTMIEAGEEEIRERHSVGCGTYASDIYRAMLSAAPQPKGE